MSVSLEWEFEGGVAVSIKTLEQVFREWIAKIETDAGEYEVKCTPAPDPDKAYGKLEVTYRRQTLFYAVFYKKKVKTEEGKPAIQARITVRRKNEGDALLRPGEHLTLNIDDRWRVNYNGKQADLADALQDVLPVRDEEQVQRISDVLHIGPEHIRMDSYQKRYVVDMPIPELQGKEGPAPERFYKYVPLDVLHKMLQKGTFRMNSIVSQSDTQETFYLGDLLCGEYEDVFKRFAGVLSERTALISSFSMEYDSPAMWRDYAGKGRGACLCFSLTGSQKLHQMQYVNKRTSALMKLKKRVSRLRQEGISVHFAAVDDKHRFVKSDKFKDEREWRLIVDCDKPLDYDLYEEGTRCVAYKEFDFKGQELPEIGLRLNEILIGPQQPCGADNFPLLAQRAHQRFGDGIVVNRSKVL